MTASDETLVRGVLKGDSSAFADLYRRWSRVIVALCCDTTGDLHAAADLTQEVFLRAYRRLGELREPERFAAWLAGIARHACREWLREQYRRHRRLRQVAARGTLKDSCPPPNTFDAGVIGGDGGHIGGDPRLGRLRDCIAALPATEGLALHVFYLQDRNIEHLCAALGMSRSAAYRLLARARQRLKDQLSRQEVSS